MRYLDMENAQIEVEINSVFRLKDKIQKYVDEFEKLNIKRLTIRTSCKDINEFIRIINDKVDFDKISFLVMIKTSLDEIPIEPFDNIILINTSDKIYQNENIYNLITLSSETIDIITKALHNDINVIVLPSIDINNIKEFNDLLSSLYDKNVGMEIALEGFLIPLSLIKEHPCNAYLCDGWKCGKRISQLPKVLYIDNNDMIYPHKFINSKVCIGKYEGLLDNVLKKYLDSEQYKYLKGVEKNVFIKYVLNYPYDLFPLENYIEWELDNDK